MRALTTVSHYHVSPDVQFLTLGQVRARFGISDSTVERWLKSGRLPQPVRFGRSRRWRLADLLAMEQTQ
jgi:excisionase family DNA binding protein